MKANELRIGNWVKIDDLPIEQITLEVFATLLRVPATVSCFSGIPLTEEWINNLGIEGRGCDQYYFGELILYKSSDGYDIKVFDEFGDGEVITPNSIQFVHQLQNLYFALTSEELTIK